MRSGRKKAEAPRADRGHKPLWICPKCGHRFVTRNLWHSCGRFPLADHFRGKSPEVRKIFDRFQSLVRRCGPVTMYRVS